MSGKKTGGKSKKVDPEVQKKQFEEWKLTDEYTKWVKLSERKNELKKDYPHDVTETTEDLTGEWQDFEDKLFDFCKTFKVKTKLKELKHEFFRSFFFAKEEKDDKWFDGIQCAVTKEHADRARHLRNKFVEIWRALDEIYDYDATTYMVAKKKMAKDLSEFLKLLVPHMKQPHKEIYEEKLGSILLPFANLLKTNMRYSAFECSYDSKEAREVVEFKYKTLVEEFCKDFQGCLRILHDVEKEEGKKIVANPDVHRIFNKLNISGWETDYDGIEFFYLSKLRTAFFTTRNHLIKLFVKGMDYWKIPLSSNQVFLEDVNKLIDCELISHRLLGDELKRDQINFAFRTLEIVLLTPAKEKMLDKKESMTKGGIPKLLIFKTLQKMREILDKKIKDQEKDQITKKQGGLFFQFSLPTIEEGKESIDEKNPSTLLKSPSKTTTKSPGKKEEEEEEERQKKIEEAERKKYGRFWLWENYVDDANKSLFLKGAEELRHVNIAVQQDIQDKIITEGLINPPEHNREHNKEENKKMREFLENLRMKDNKKDEINNVRPPTLWNHPKVWEDSHEYRSNARPQECYKDNRIQTLEETIEVLGTHLLEFQKDHFFELINRVIDCFNKKYNEKPNPHSIY